MKYLLSSDMDDIFISCYIIIIFFIIRIIKCLGFNEVFIEGVGKILRFVFIFMVIMIGFR